MKTLIIAATIVARNVVSALKLWIAEKLEQLDANEYVVCVWNGSNWQVILQNLKSKREALAARNLHSANMDIAPSYISVFTHKTAVKFGMYN